MSRQLSIFAKGIALVLVLVMLVSFAAPVRASGCDDLEDKAWGRDKKRRKDLWRNHPWLRGRDPCRHLSWNSRLCLFLFRTLSACPNEGC